MRKVVMVIMSFVLIVTMTVPALAAAAGTFLMQEYDVSDETIILYGKRLPENGTMTASAGSQVLERAGFSTLEQENIPVTVYCLVDTSTSQSEVFQERKKDILLTFSSLMAAEDNMVLNMMDASLNEGKPLSDKTARDTAIETLSGQSWYTNLYDGMHQAMESLQTSTAYHTNRCLVVISDGHDDGRSTATAEKVLKQIQDAGIPVYTVILSEATVTQDELMHHERFAADSLGGLLVIPDREDISAAVAAQRIWENIKGASVIRLDAKELQERKTDQQILIRYETADTRYEDTVLVRAVDLKVPEETAPVETTVPETIAETTVPEPKKQGGTVILIGGIAAAVLFVLGVVLVVTRKKKPAEESTPAEEVADTDPVWEDGAAADSAKSEWGDSWERGNQELQKTMPIADKLHVFAVGIMHQEVATDFYLTQNIETTFGRTAKAEIILNDKDMKLSGVHGCFFWDGKMLLVRDMNSKNGTFVNEEMCHEKVWLRIEDGAILRAGNYEYRVSFREDKMQQKPKSSQSWSSI